MLIQRDSATGAIVMANGFAMPYLDASAQWVYPTITLAGLTACTTCQVGPEGSFISDTPPDGTWDVEFTGDTDQSIPNGYLHTPRGGVQICMWDLATNDARIHVAPSGPPCGSPSAGSLWFSVGARDGVLEVHAFHPEIVNGTTYNYHAFYGRTNCDSAWGCELVLSNLLTVCGSQVRHGKTFYAFARGGTATLTWSVNA